jgi:hypothetical protein
LEKSKPPRTSFLPEEKQELPLFLATRLHGERGTTPERRKFSKEEMDAWIAEDDADMRESAGRGVRLFLDTGVLLAASASANGASREIFVLAPTKGWVLIATPYGLAEVMRNLPEFPPATTTNWLRLRVQMLSRSSRTAFK